MGDVILGVDFKHKPRKATDPDFPGIAELADYHSEAIEIANVALIGSPPVADTAPSEYSAPEFDGA